MKKLEKVLIVENENGKAERVIRILNGFEVNYVLKGAIKEAVEAIKNAQFDLLIIDLGLPKSMEEPFEKGKDGRNGVNMLLELAEQGIRIPTIIYSFNWLYDYEKKTLKELNYPFIAQVFDYVIIRDYIRREFEVKDSG